MVDIKSIEYENNEKKLIINISDKIQILYKDILNIIDDQLLFKYLENLFCIIDDWEKEYINTKMIGGNNWKLSIAYMNGNKKEYSGKSSYPTNFEAFERLNQKLINEVQNG